MASTARGLKINNPLNIRKSANKWQGLANDQPDPAFAAFTSIQFGLRAGARILLNYQKDGCQTVSAMISRWAPPSDDNPTPAYILNVAAAMSIAPDAVIDIDQVALMLPMLQAMAKQETGFTAADSVFMDAMRMAGVSDAKPKPLITSNQVVAAVGSVATSGGAAVMALQGVVGQTSTALQPYAEANHHVGQAVAILAGVGAALAASAVIFAVIKHRATGA